MRITSKNFSITLGNGDMLCMGDVVKNGEPYEIVNGEQFLKKVANYALELAESNLESERLKNEAVRRCEEYWEAKVGERTKVTRKGSTITFERMPLEEDIEGQINAIDMAIAFLNKRIKAIKSREVVSEYLGDLFEREVESCQNEISELNERKDKLYCNKEAWNI